MLVTAGMNEREEREGRCDREAGLDEGWGVEEQSMSTREQ